MQNELSHLDWLEAEAIHIMREVAGQCSNPVLLFSGGKDSLCLLRIAEKAFRPGKFPFPLMHIDTGHNYQEVIDFRDRKVTELNERLIVRSVEDSMARGTVKLNYELEPRPLYRNVPEGAEAPIDKLPGGQDPYIVQIGSPIPHTFVNEYGETVVHTLSNMEAEIA